MQATRKVGWQDSGLIAAVGFLAIASQTLLFRVFLTVFEGNELGIACFFASWLVWVAAGAVCGRIHTSATGFLARRFEFLALLYLPAYVLQWWLLTSARELAGVQPYELLPLLTMLPVTFLCNAPVSFCTGLLFTLACRWMSDAGGLPVARVYVLETIGSVVGGLAVTLLLAAGMAGELVFLCAALLLTLMFGAYRLARGSYISAAVPALAVAAVLLSGMPGRWEHHGDNRTWRRILATGTCGGSFTTPEGRYLYGEYGDQFNVVAWETVTDVIPATEHASEVIALHLAQRPAARRFLVAGRGAYAICTRLLELPQAETVTWLDPDPAYPPALLSVLPARLKAGADRLHTPAGDMRGWLEGTTAQYDVIMMNLPDATTLALNRYFTVEYFRLLKNRLGKDGILGVRISAGENFMSDDRVNIGASVLASLRPVFRNIVLKPGEESWLIASDGPDLATAPALLRDRFAGVEGASRIYPPDGLMALYMPQRTEYQMQRYEEVARNTPGDLLLNTDRTPRALMHGLLFAARETGAAAGFGNSIRTFALHGAMVLPVALLLLPLLRFVFLARAHGTRSRSGFTGTTTVDDYVLVFTTGAAGMGICVVLMYLYQSAFGSIFLHIGVITALWMAGLAAGSSLATRLLSASSRMSSATLRFIIPANMVLCGLILLLAGNPTRAGFAATFVTSGFLCGFYVPTAASRLGAAGVGPATAGAWIEALDHLGGALGGFVAGLVVLPLFGTTYGLLLLAILPGCNIAALRRPATGECADTVQDRIRRLARPAGYLLFGATVFAVAAGLMLNRSTAEDTRQAFLAFAQSTAGKQELQARQQALRNGGVLDYFCVTAESATGTPRDERFIFRTDMLTPDVSGYGGPVTMAVAVDADGTLRDARILRSDETPSYLAFLKPWMAHLIGRNIFEPDPLKDVDAVTGATLTSTAVLRILRRAGPSFAVETQGRQAGQPAAPEPSTQTDYKPAAWLVISLVAALVLHAWPSRRLRLGLLVLVVCLSGVVFNAQYSLAHVFALLGLAIPPAGWGIAFLVVVAVPVLVALLGNIYCGYLCPFGALQELIGELRPASLRTDPGKEPLAWARYVKYLLLAFLTILFGATLHTALASGDPLVTVFARERSRLLLGLAGTVLVLSFFYPRFWCRTLCPAGAFLSLLNGIRPIRQLRPPVFPAACAYGVRNTSDMDCLCCDRCRRPGRREKLVMTSQAARAATHPANAILLAATTVLAIGLATHAVTDWRRTLAEASQHSRAVTGGGGIARPVDMQKLRNLIDQGQLSDKEASFYRQSTPELKR